MKDGKGGGDNIVLNDYVISVVWPEHRDLSGCTHEDIKSLKCHHSVAILLVAHCGRAKTRKRKDQTSSEWKYLRSIRNDKTSKEC